MNTLPIEIKRVILGEFVDRDFDVRAVELTCKLWLTLSRGRTHLSSHRSVAITQFNRYPNLKVVDAWCDPDIPLERLKLLQQSTIRIQYNDRISNPPSLQFELAKTHIVNCQYVVPVFKEVESWDHGRRPIINQICIGYTPKLRIILSSNVLKIKLYDGRWTRQHEQIIYLLPSTYSIELDGIRKIPELLKPVHSIKFINPWLMGTSSQHFINICQMVQYKIEIDVELRPTWIDRYISMNKPKPQLFIKGKLIE